MGCAREHEVVGAQLVDVFKSLHLGRVDEEPAVARQTDKVVDDVAKLYDFIWSHLVGAADVHVAIEIVLLVDATLAVPQL